MATLCSNLKCIHEKLIKERKCNGLISVYFAIYMLFFLSLFCFLSLILTDIIFINNSLMLLIINAIVNWLKSKADGITFKKQLKLDLTEQASFEEFFEFITFFYWKFGFYTDFKLSYDLVIAPVFII